MNSNFKSKVENLINSNFSNTRNEGCRKNLFNLNFRSLRNSYSSSKLRTISYDNNNNNTDKKQNNKDTISNYQIDFSLQSINNKYDNNYKEKKLRKNNSLKNIVFSNKMNNNFKINLDTLNREINNSFNPYNKPNKFNIGNSNQEDIHHKIEDLTNELKKKNNGKNIKEKIFDFTNELKTNNSFVNRPITNYSNNLNLNEYLSPLNKGKIKNLSRGKSITNLFNDNKNDFFKQFTSKKLIVKTNHKKDDNKKIIQDYLKEFNYPYLNKQNLFKRTQSNKMINLNF